MLKGWWITSRGPAEAGFSVVEVLLAATVLGMLATGMVGALVYGRASTADAGDTARANYLAEEGVEAARNIGDASFANLADGTYGITQNGTQFVFAGTSDITDIYTRQVTVATAGTNRKTITGAVTWTADGGGSVTHTARLTNWAANLKLWSNATLAASTDVPSSTNDAIKTWAGNGYAYTVLNVTGVTNFVVTNLVTDTNIASLTLPGSGKPANITVSGNYAYIADTTDSQELKVVDISNPAAPVYKVSLDLTGTGNGQSITVSGHYVYEVRASDNTAGANEFNVIDISNPLAPTVVGGYNNNISMNGICVKGNYAFVATGSTSQEMLVINIINPAAPTLAATYNPSTPNAAANTVACYGNTVLLGMSTTLDAVNIITPTSPARLGTFTAAGTINDIAVDVTNQVAFLATSSTTGEFQAVNVSNPAAMTLAKTVDIPGTTSTLTGVSYDDSLDLAVGASASDTQEVVIFSRN